VIPRRDFGLVPAGVVHTRQPRAAVHLIAAAFAAVAALAPAAALVAAAVAAARLATAAATAAAAAGARAVGVVVVLALLWLLRQGTSTGRDTGGATTHSM
jgi:hypothetical protein